MGPKLVKLLLCGKIHKPSFSPFQNTYHEWMAIAKSKKKNTWQSPYSVQVSCLCLTSNNHKSPMWRLPPLAEHGAKRRECVEPPTPFIHTHTPWSVVINVLCKSSSCWLSSSTSLGNSLFFFSQALHYLFANMFENDTALVHCKQMPSQHAAAAGKPSFNRSG